MKKDISLLLKEFVETSGLKISYIGKNIGIDRSILSKYIHQHMEVSFVHGKRILDFIESYKKRWA